MNSSLGVPAGFCRTCQNGTYCRCVVALNVWPDLPIEPCGDCRGFIGCPDCEIEPITKTELINTFVEE